MEQTEQTELMGRFNDAVRATLEERGDYSRSDDYFDQMAAAHAQVIAFFESIQAATEMAVRAYRSNARINGVMSRLGWFMDPGHFMGISREYRLGGREAPRLALMDTASGTSVVRIEAQCIRPLDEPIWNSLGIASRATGYEIERTGIRFELGQDAPDTSDAARKIAGAITRQMETYLRERSFIDVAW